LSNFALSENGNPYTMNLKTNSKLLICILSGLLIIGCHKKEKPEKAFYYWKTVFHLSASQEKFLGDLGVSKIYIRFFDVDVNSVSGQLEPRAKIHFKEVVPASYEIVPVVYITNKSFLISNPAEIPDFAANVLNLVNDMAANNKIKYKEIQIDCDWTDNSKTKYFSFLKAIKFRLAKNKQLLSATIRLHQIKYKTQTGIPPVDKGMLMYYNMGKITPDETSNSIYNTNDAAKYVDYCKEYPLPFDVVLPVFSWGIHVRKNKIVELINNMKQADLDNNTNFLKINAVSFIALQSFFLDGNYYMKDDIVRIEGVTPTDCLEAAQQLKNNLIKPIKTIAIFHLDSLITNHYETKDFEKIFNTFN